MSDEKKKDETAIEPLPEVTDADLEQIAGGFKIPGVRPDDSVGVSAGCVTWTKVYQMQ
jgi:hypothetical protein